MGLDEFRDKVFGEGAVINIDKARKYIIVQFSAGEKRFVLQDSFDRGFLSFVEDTGRITGQSG